MGKKAVTKIDDETTDEESIDAWLGKFALVLKPTTKRREKDGKQDVWLFNGYDKRFPACIKLENISYCFKEGDYYIFEGNSALPTKSKRSKPDKFTLTIDPNSHNKAFIDKYFRHCEVLDEEEQEPPTIIHRPVVNALPGKASVAMVESTKEPRKEEKGLTESLPSIAVQEKRGPVSGICSQPGKVKQPTSFAVPAPPPQRQTSIASTLAAYDNNIEKLPGNIVKVQAFYGAQKFIVRLISNPSLSEATITADLEGVLRLNTNALIREIYTMVIVLRMSAADARGRCYTTEVANAMMSWMTTGLDDEGIKTRVWTVLQPILVKRLKQAITKNPMWLVDCNADPGINLGRHLYSLDATISALIPAQLDDTDTLFHQLSTKNLSSLGPSLLMWTKVTEENFASFPLLQVGQDNRVHCPRSFLNGFTEPTTVEEWLSLRWFITMISIGFGDPSGKRLPVSRDHSLVSRCKEAADRIRSPDGLSLKRILEDVILYSPGPETMVWATSVLWKSFDSPNTKTADHSMVRISNIACRSLQHCIAEAIQTKGNIYKYHDTVLTVNGLRSENCKDDLHPKKKARGPFERPPQVYPMEDLALQQHQCSSGEEDDEKENYC